MVSIVLGAALGSEDWVRNHYASLAHQSEGLINSILSMESKQCAFLLLKHCANSRIAHITRLSPPVHTKEATLIHDSLMEDSLSKLLGVSHLTEIARKQVHLKSHNGGLGITSMFDQRHHAFLASWADSLRQLASRLPDLETELALVRDPTSTTTSSQALRECHQFLIEKLDEVTLTVEDLHLAPPRLQSKLGRDLDSSRLSSLLDVADQSARARLLSSSCKEASAWIDTLPLTQHLTLSTDVFCIGILMRLGLPIPLTRGLTICPNSKCSATVDPEGLHLLTCNKGPGRVRLHDGMVRAWHSLIISTGLRAMVEQRGLYPDQRRPDIVVPDFSEGRELQLDFSATHPCLPTNLNLASRDPGAAAARREQEKRHRYSDSNGLFEPIVCEHHGRWGVAAIELLKKLARSAGESIPRVTHWQFRDFWMKALGVSLQKNIAQTMINNAQEWNRSSNFSQELVCHFGGVINFVHCMYKYNNVL